MPVPKKVLRMCGGYKNVLCTECNAIITVDKPLEVNTFYCGNCGKIILDAAHDFCGWCGEKIEWGEADKCETQRK